MDEEKANKAFHTLTKEKKNAEGCKVASSQTKRTPQSNIKNVGFCDYDYNNPRCFYRSVCGSIKSLENH